MRGRWGTTVVAGVLVMVWVLGFQWFRGDPPFGGGKDVAPAAAPVSPAADVPQPSPIAPETATPTPTPTPTPPPTPSPRRTPKPSPSYAATVTPQQERQPVAINPTLARPAPKALAPVADFTMATFNLLGSSHTKGASSRASGPQRMNGALQVLAQHQVTVVGFQEFQPDQRAAFGQRAQGWQMFPGLQMGRRAGENSVAWRSDTWEPVRTELVSIPYFNGNPRPMPYVLLKHKATGVQAWFSTFHNPADVRQFQHQQRHRTAATTREINLFNDLGKSGQPVFVTGDMNERDEYFCRVTGSTQLRAAAGGNHDGGCHPPKPIGIDWIFGSPQVVFDGYRVDRSPLVRRTTDHPVVVTHVSVDALNFPNAYVPAAPTTP